MLLTLNFLVVDFLFMLERKFLSQSSNCLQHTAVMVVTLWYMDQAFKELEEVPLRLCAALGPVGHQQKRITPRPFKFKPS